MVQMKRSTFGCSSRIICLKSLPPCPLRISSFLTPCPAIAEARSVSNARCVLGFMLSASLRSSWPVLTPNGTVLPTVPFGVNTGQLDLRLALNMNPSTHLALLTDLASAIAGQGVRKLLILNGHGGNDFRQMIRELQPKVDLFICTINWWTCVKGADYFDEPGDHAGEMETSVMMSLEPDLVLPLTEAGPGRARKFRIAGLRDGWVWSPRQWSSVTSDTGTGNPAASTPAKGEKFLSAVTERIGGFLFELAKADRNNMYE